MRFFALILSALALLFVLSEADAAGNVNFSSLSQEYAGAKLPTAEDLLSHAWGFAAVVGNPSLALNHDAADRVNLLNGIKNPDNSQMYLQFRNDVPKNIYPFLAIDRYNNFSAGDMTLFNRVDQSVENKNVSYTFDMGMNDGTYYNNECRLSSSSQSQYLICQVTYIITDQATNPIYKTPKYQQANGKIVVFQIFKRDLQ